MRVICMKHWKRNTTLSLIEKLNREKTYVNVLHLRCVWEESDSQIQYVRCVCRQAGAAQTYRTKYTHHITSHNITVYFVHGHSTRPMCV